MKKLLVILTVLLFIIGTVIFGVAASNDTVSEQPTESARFGGASLLLENTVVMRYYVSLEGVSDPYGVSVLVWSEAQESYQKGGEKYSVPYEGRQKTANGVSYYCFDFDGFNAKMIADDFYAVVCISTEGGYVYSDPLKYSVLEYSHFQLNNSSDAKLTTLIKDMLDYGAAAQIYFNYRTDRLANECYYLVNVSGATLEDGFTKGLYKSGQSLTLTADERSAEGDFSYWADGDGAVISESRTVSITVGSDLTLNAVYGVTLQTEAPALTMPSFDVGSIPKYSQKEQIGYVTLNGGTPFFTNNQIVSESYEYYSPLDSLGRCGTAVACLGVDLMPTEERGDISSVKPTGWISTASDPIVQENVPGASLYNRSHLIAHSLAGEDANRQNLITGTQSFNQVYMQIFENLVLDVMKEYKSAGEDRHVMYRVTPVFEGNNLVATGVIMEGWSVEDNGADVCFCVFVYNEQPGFTIDFATGDYSIYDGTEDGGSSGSEGDSGTTEPDTPTESEETAYYLTITLNNVTYYFTGDISSGVGAATTDKSQALKLYIEESNNTYHIYSKDSEGKKTYYGTGSSSKSLTPSTTALDLTKSGEYYLGSSGRTFSYYQDNNGTVTFRTYETNLRPATFILAE